MFSAPGLGLAATLASGLLQGSMLTPMKYLRKWRWENIWLIFSASGYFLLPWVVAFVTVPHLSTVYGSTSAAVLLRTGLFGFGWGFAAVLFGLGIELIGLALGYAIILGLGTSVGAMVPLLTLHPEKPGTPAGLGTISGVVMLLVSVTLLSVAGKKREVALHQAGGEPSGPDSQGGASKRTFLKGLVICILCGVLNPLINFALAYGAEIQSQAIQYGSSPASAANAIWVVVGSAGFIPNLIYCAYLLSTNSTWRVFTLANPSYWAVVPSMGFMWIFGTVLYGVGANLLGPLGAVIGWTLVMCCIILTATFWGFLAGEWKGVRGSPIRIMAAGLAILVAAIFVLGLSSRL